jgi:hypothetical protein
MLRIIFISLLFISSLSHAEETRQADAHVHGLNNLTMVLSQNQIAMTYEMPIIQLYDEHDEHDEHDESAINNEALKVFQNHLQLFEFPIEAECEISSFKSGLHSVSTEEGDHQDVELAYEFYCNKPSLLKNLTITAFDRFSELETLNFDAVINNKGFTKRFKSEDNKIIF